MPTAVSITPGTTPSETSVSRGSIHVITTSVPTSVSPAAQASSRLLTRSSRTSTMSPVSRISRSP